jgi:hypothetical protein
LTERRQSGLKETQFWSPTVPERLNRGQTSAWTAMFVKNASQSREPPHSPSYNKRMIDLPPVMTSNKSVKTRA